MSATPLSDSREVVERSLFHSIRRELVDKGYLPDISGISSFPINQITVLTNTIRVTGNAASLYTAGRIFSVTGSTGNNQNFTVVSSAFSSPNTSIIVVEAIPDATADGQINIYTYYDDNAGVASYKAAITSVISTKGFCIELFGVSSPEAKLLKKVPRISIITNQTFPGAIGGSPDRVYQGIGSDPLNPDSYTASKLPPQTADFTYDIHIISNTAEQSRIMHGIVSLALPKRGYIPLYNNANSRMFVEQYSYRNIPDSLEGINEDIYMYRVTDIFETENETVQEGIAPITQITVDRNQGLPPNSSHIDDYVYP